MRILLADSFPEPQLQRLTRRGHDVRYEPDLGAEDLPNAIADADVLVVRSTPVMAETIETSEQLGLIVRAGAGTNTIDTRAASERAIYVSNVPGRNSVAVAELAMGLILALDRQIPDNVSELRNEHWRKTRFSKGRGLKGRRLGIIGMGAIGTEVATRARSFGMKILALDRPDRSDEVADLLVELGAKLYPDLPSLLADCDIVTIHVPAGPETMGMVDSEFLDHLPDGAYLVNTSRADVVVERDLLQALDQKDLWAAIDVYPDEPDTGEASFTSKLAKHPHVYGTHHIGASTDQAQEAIAKQVVKIIDEYGDGGVKSVVNLSEPMEHTTVVGIRHVDKVGVLSRVFAVLRSADINVEHMENHVFDGAKAAKAVLNLHGAFDDAVRKELEGLDGVFHVGVLRDGR
ncbi:MAG TPA: phosphoglycerate dehydrogenase [Acidimicrobiia bacterium]